MAEENAMTNEEIIEKIKEKVLTKHLHNLSQKLNPKTHFPYLRSELVLTYSECQEITNLPSHAAQTNLMIEILISKGQKGFDALIDSLLEDRTQLELVKGMNITLEEEYNKAFKKPPVHNPDSDDEELPDTQGLPLPQMN